MEKEPNGFPATGDVPDFIPQNSSHEVHSSVIGDFRTPWVTTVRTLLNPAAMGLKKRCCHVLPFWWEAAKDDFLVPPDSLTGHPGVDGPTRHWGFKMI